MGRDPLDQGLQCFELVQPRCSATTILCCPVTPGLWRTRLEQWDHYLRAITKSRCRSKTQGVFSDQLVGFMKGLGEEGKGYI